MRLNKSTLRSRILLAALFATGLSGIVAEYMLATLATYFLGNSVVQWTLILSFMLFAMGVGSRLSKFLENKLIEKFIIIEFILSLLVSFCTLMTYSSMLTENNAVSFTRSYGVIIYSLAILIGILIGMEIPLVTRINSEFKELKVNIAGVMEKDYYGSLIGGVFFAFIGLPFFGLTYTPFILGTVNFIVAVTVLVIFSNTISVSNRIGLYLFSVLVLVSIVNGIIFARPIIRLGEESRYVDKVIFSKETKYQKITLTEYHGDYWLYLDSHTQLSSFDEWLYHEPLVHPVMSLSHYPKEVLVLGGGDGCAIREVLKYDEVDSVILVDIDPVMTDLGTNHPVLREINQNAYHDSRVKVMNQDAFIFLEQQKRYFDVIIIDFPDPRTIELNRLYTLEFYKLCRRRLRPNGVLATQAGSPYVTTAAFKSIEKTMSSAGFNTLPIHNHVFSFGEWGWVLGAKNIEKDAMKKMLLNTDFSDMETRWINNEAMYHITSFGQDFRETGNIEINTIFDPVTYIYYERGISRIMY